MTNSLPVSEVWGVINKRLLGWSLSLEFELELEFEFGFPDASFFPVFYNYTGDQTCYDINEGISPGLGSGWDVQACTEVRLVVLCKSYWDLTWRLL